MATVKKYWKMGVVCLALLSAGSAILIHHFLSAPAKAQEVSPVATSAPAAAPATDPMAALAALTTYSQVRSLREELGLTDEILAAMGCTADQASSLLTSLLSWQQSNQATLDQADQACAQATANARAAMQQQWMGPAAPGLPAQTSNLGAAVSTAVQNRMAVIKSCRSQMEASLSDSQKAIWRTSLANRSVPDRYRFVPDLTAEQGQALRLAWRHYARPRASARTDTDRSNAESAFSTAEGGILSTSQQTAAAQCMTAVQANMTGVLNASAQVLPVPAPITPADLSQGTGTSN